MRDGCVFVRKQERFVVPQPCLSSLVVSLPLLVSSEIKLLTKILASHYAVSGETR